MVMVDILKKVLNPVITVGHDSSLGRVKMKEDGAGTKFHAMWLNGIHAINTVAFRLDHPKPPFKVKSPFLKREEKWIHCGCDYVVVTEIDGAMHALFCECKSDDIAGGKNQLFFSRVFWTYLAALTEAVADVKNPTVTLHFVLFRTRPTLDKRATAPGLQRVDKYKGLTVKVCGNPSRINVRQLL